jgi:tetratricopeptide (TPR) repeat protein
MDGEGRVTDRWEQAMTAEKRIAQLIEDVDRLINDGHFEEALATLAEVCELKRGIRGSGVDYAVCLTSLALLHRSLGDEASALPRFRSASEVLARELGDRDHYYWSSLENLAESYEGLGDFVEAEKVYLRLLDFAGTAWVNVIRTTCRR